MRKFIAGLVVGIVLTASFGVAANSGIRIFVNGKELHTKAYVSEKVTMVPLRSIADALGASVEYKDGIATVNPDKWSCYYRPMPPALTEIKEIPIQGSDEFISIISSALRLLREQDPLAYMFVTQNVNRIMEWEGATGIWYTESGYFITSKINQNITKDLSIVYQAGFFVHEATHAWLRNNGYKYHGYEAELFCNTMQAKTYKTLGASDYAMRYVLVDIFQTKWWENPYQ